MDSGPDVFFLPAGSGGTRGQRLCLHHRPACSPARAAFVYIHPFAEEMNKSRRMAALQSRALAAAGCAVLQIDLLGCGDSSGDFADATWDDWIEDVVEAAAWIRSRHAAPLWLWGLRAGCLLGTQAAARIEGPCNLLLWQAPASGNMLLQQFLRLKVVGDRIERQAKGMMQQLRDQIANGEAVEIAGYRLAARLLQGLEAATLQQPAAPGRVHWLELAARDSPTLLPASAITVERWRRAGIQVNTRVVRGPAFWQTSEVQEVPALIEAATSEVATAASV